MCSSTHLSDFDRGDAPVGRAGGEQLDHREAQPAHLRLEGHADGFLGQADVLRVVQAAAHDIARAVHRGEHLRHADADNPACSTSRPVGRGGRLLAGQRGGRHLAAGHAVDGIVDEDDGDILAAAGGVHDLGHADRGQVAVALVGEDDPVGQDALDAGGHGRGAAVRGFDEIGVEIVVGKNRAAHRRNADGFLAQCPSRPALRRSGGAPRRACSRGSNGSGVSVNDSGRE